jgi:hydrogenase nickel incorporation protein HypA/HybF
MHELSIATSLLDEVLAQAKEHGDGRVRQIDLEVGVMRLVFPDALRESFAIISEGTPAEGATLKLTEIPLQVVCNSCRQEYSPSIEDFRCPSCRMADVRILAGNDIIIRTIAMDVNRAGDAG